MKNKLKTKDLIYAGAFGAIYLVAALVIVMGTGIIPVLYILSPLIVGVICATVYMVYVTKVRKFGAILILAVLFGLVTSSVSFLPLIWSVAMGIIAELIARGGKYHSKSMFMVSYLVFNLNMIGPFFMLVYAKKQFLTMSIKYYGEEYGRVIDKLTPSWIIFALAALAVAGALIGVLLAGGFMKKHFEKAGIV